MLGTLFVVATPIGNLEDISRRAIRILGEVDLILAEDTRVTKKLLNYYDIDTYTLSYHQHTKEDKKLLILKDLIEGKNVALVTDAGTPGVSDPGNELISFVLEREPLIQIIPVPGPSSLTVAMSISGINLSQFIFAGFLPKKRRARLFTQVKNAKLPLVFFESPKRIIKTLGVLADEFGKDTQIFIARELTKLHETLYRGTIEEVLKQLKGMQNIKGELVVVLSVRQKI